MRLCREAEGSVDIVTDIRPLDTLKVAESKFAKVVKSRSSTLLYGTLNQRKRGSKFRDIRLRQALNYAINRKELRKYAARGNAYNPGAFVIPPGTFGYNPDLQPYDYDTEKARALLTQAGYPEGFEVKIITHESWKLEAQLIKRMLRRIDLKVDLNIVTFSEFWKKWYIPASDKPPEEQDWDMTIDLQWDAYGHPGATFLAYPLLQDSNARWIEYDPAYEEMWKDMAGTVDATVQEEKMRQAVQYVYDRAYNLFIYSPLTLYAVNKEVDFVPFKSRHLYLKETSVTDKHWSLRGEKK